MTKNTVTVKVNWTPQDQAVDHLDVYDMRITIDEDNPHKVWIYLLNERGEEVEGGSFDKHDFMDAVLRFYNQGF